MATLAEATALATGRGEATLLAALVHGVGDPVDLGVATDDLVRVVDHDDLEVLVRGVLVDPVRVEHAQVRELVAGTLLGHRAQVAFELELVDTVVLGLTVHNTLGVRALAATATDGDTHDDVTLLGLVAETAGLVDTRGAGEAVDHGQLAVLPGAHTQEETQHIRLLSLPELFQVLVGTHCFCLAFRLMMSRVQAPSHSKGPAASHSGLVRYCTFHPMVKPQNLLELLSCNMVS